MQMYGEVEVYVHTFTSSARNELAVQVMLQATFL
jgi:hypothetical protein